MQVRGVKLPNSVTSIAIFMRFDEKRVPGWGPGDVLPTRT